jgi:hypothetical protein
LFLLQGESRDRDFWTRQAELARDSLAAAAFDNFAFLVDEDRAENAVDFDAGLEGVVFLPSSRRASRPGRAAFVDRFGA